MLLVGSAAGSMSSCSLLVNPLWSWMLCRGVCLLSQLAKVPSEEPCSSHLPGQDPRLPPRSQGTFPAGQDRGRHSTLQHLYLSGRDPGGAAAGGTASTLVTLIFPSAVGSALRGAPNNTTKTSLSRREHLPGFPCLAPASGANRTLLVLTFLFGSVTFL